MNSEKEMAKFGVRQLPPFNHLRLGWSNCESFSDSQDMSGLNIEVFEIFLVENGRMR